MNNSILPARFYGHSLDELYSERESKIEEAKRRRPVDPWDAKPRSLLRPSRYKEEFWKQNEALANAANYSQSDDILCCFVFQDESERRRFIVTYPEDFWEDCENLPPERRVFYEVIPEFSPCFLYYDLEFEVDLNQEKNGVRMTQTLIDITCEYIGKYWKLPCDRSAVINLDSSRPGKFSKHIIFSTKSFAFLDNYHVGYLVKMICGDIVDYVAHKSTEHHDILHKFSKDNIQELYVDTTKGKRLFVDLNVYTKNRHFRTYKATKWGKCSFLKRAPECQFAWPRMNKSQELDIFVNSLISYLPRKKQLKLLSFDQGKKTQILSYSQHTSMKKSLKKEFEKSPYPMLDKYVSDFVKPGKVRDIKFIESKQMIIYEIVGNRYCNNIGRWHKSNNVYYVVDVMNKIIYQKCHDTDCAGYASVPKKLPIAVTFYFEDEVDTLFFNLSDCNGPIK